MKTEIGVFQDVQRHVCLQVSRSEQHQRVEYIPLETSAPLSVRRLPLAVFDAQFSPVEGYDAVRCCQLFLGYAASQGITKDALEHIKKQAKITAAWERQLLARTAEPEE